ncbi:type II CAAX prenyl endopeptidase Rce1 family protein [Phenylobacterium sp.]|uniref:CPBP family glutamic-type intramembrane protease n=1 Tax=Phenylobacterium sp. TaxID=1871053 RepID=UPI00286CD6D9|nr:CPBP family glutamic-type intramembrane protease [Phenylobacterium sp.]
MITAWVKFAVFVVAVLALPAALMASGDPQVVDLGKLAMILSPGVAGLALNFGLGDRGLKARWGQVALAAGVTLAVVAAALVPAFASGLAAFRAPGLAPSGLAAVVAGSALTSVLEELGWAGGGLALAIKAFGRRAGVLVLGLVWAAWHLIPTMLKVGLFPDLEAASPAMLAAFVASCLIYRELLTQLRERAATWWAAAAGHAAPNILLAGLLGAGLGFDLTRGWWFFPAPGGLVFPAMALLAVVMLRRRARA